MSIVSGSDHVIIPRKYLTLGCMGIVVVALGPMLLAQQTVPSSSQVDHGVAVSSRTSELQASVEALQSRVSSMQSNVEQLAALEEFSGGEHESVEKELEEQLKAMAAHMDAVTEQFQGTQQLASVHHEAGVDSACESLEDRRETINFYLNELIDEYNKHKLTLPPGLAEDMATTFGTDDGAF